MRLGRLAFEPERQRHPVAFVESCWALIADEPDVWYWSVRFIEAGGVEALA
jgi:hypothetical protein